MGYNGPAMTPKELFESVLPKILREHPERAREVAATICFEITGEEGGRWIVDAQAIPPRVVTETTGVVACTISAHAADFQAMLAEPRSALTLFQQGKIRVSGDTVVATRFHHLFR
jgi:ubiquinone biosynthesis protein UbiJ